MNYSVFSLLVGQEFQSFPQRYAIGVEVPRDENDNPVNPFKVGPDRVWVADAAKTGEGTSVAMGQFDAANLEQMVKVKQEIRLSMAQVTVHPSHYFMLPTGLISGESQKTAEQKLDAKVEDREASFGDTWASAMSLAVRMLRGGRMDGLTFDTNWKYTKPRMERELWEIAGLQEMAGVNKRQVLRERGYTDEQIDAFGIPPDPEDGVLRFASCGNGRGSGYQRGTRKGVEWWNERNSNPASKVTLKTRRRSTSPSFSRALLLSRPV